MPNTFSFSSVTMAPFAAAAASILASVADLLFAGNNGVTACSGITAVDPPDEDDVGAGVGPSVAGIKVQSILMNVDFAP